MRPLAEPANLGAMSMGMDHMGPIVNSEKKNARLKKMAAEERLCTNNNGNMEASEHRNPITTRFRRALLRLPVRDNILSLRTPPRVFPTTPAKKTPAEKNAESCNFR
jgi:hypothetical protein